VEMPVVQETLREITICDSLSFDNPHVFLVGYAFGKTKSLFNIAQHCYTILLDISATHYIDIKVMMSKFEEIIMSTKKVWVRAIYMCNFLNFVITDQAA
jgi:hypothetical protein